MHPIGESDVGCQVLTVEHIRRIDIVHDIAVSRIAFDPEFHIIAGNKLTFAERKHHVLNPDRTHKQRARIIFSRV